MNKFLVGLILGIAIAGGLAVYLSNAPMEYINKNVSNSDTDQKGIGASGTVKLAPSTKLREQDNTTVSQEIQDIPDTPEESNKQNYDFFDVLQTKQVANQKNTNTTTTTTTKKTASQAENQPKTDKIFVQAGTYSSYSDAEDAKAQIAFMGLDAKISKANVSGHQINRVVLGPIPNEDLANQVKNKLRSEGFNASVVKVSTN